MPIEVFISHISAERELAVFLKEQLEKHFLGLVNVFVSSDEESIEAGAAWLDAVKRALTTAELQLVLCSVASTGRPWVNFEAGAAWVRGIPVVPLCHSGLEPAHLPMPLSALQGGSVTNPETFVRLYNRIAKLVPCNAPEIDMNALATGAAKIQSAGSTPPEAVTPPPATFDRLQSLAEAGDVNAIKELGLTQSERAWTVLVQIAANSIENEAKIAALRALASFRTPGDVLALCELLVQDRWQVAEACAKALGRFRDARAIPYLIKASDQHVDWVTTQAAASALGLFAPQSPNTVCPALVRALDLGSFEGEAAAQSLARYGATALPFLMEYLKSDAAPRNAGQVLKAIALIGDKGVRPDLEAIRTRWRETIQNTSRDVILGEIDKALLQLAPE